MLKQKNFIIAMIIVFITMCGIAYANNKIGGYAGIQDLAGKKIGVQAGTRSPEVVKQFIPTAQLVYHDSPADNLIALRTGKIEAVCLAEPTARLLMHDNNDVAALGSKLTNVEMAPIFQKSERGKKLSEKYAEFVKSLWEDGTISELDAAWLGGDESKRILKDYTKLPAVNGTLQMAADLSAVPFVYVKENKIIGYDIDIAVRFCEANGYGLKIVPMAFTAIIPAVQSGKCDFSSSLTRTPERAESVLFSSVPNAKTGSLLLVRKDNNIKLADLAGRKVGIILGANHDIFAAAKIPDVKLEYFNDLSAITLALQTGKIDAFANTLPTAVYMTHEHKDISYISEPLEVTDTYSAFTNSEKGKKICGEYAEFIKSLWDNGTIKRLADKWIYSEDENLRTLEDYSQLPDANGVLKMAIDTGRMPFAYVKENKIIGYDIELAMLFCKAKGYGLEVYSMNFAGILGAIKAGKCDLTGSITRTPERAETMLFSPVPNAQTPIVLLVMKTKDAAVNIAEPSFWEDTAASFERTFIREDRWKLFAEGIINSLIITVMSILCGMLLGFTVFMLCRTGSRAANAVTKFSVWLIKGTPIVVLLMILYYIVFGHVNISGIAVSIIAFSLTFGTSVYRMLTFGTGAVDKGQTEAAYTLGFTDMQTFFMIVLPQAAMHFMPSLKEEITMLVKSTSIVGYIAVQDLTKMGDIVRSRTYEAFFPLIAVAVIYFIMSWILNIIINFIYGRITPSRIKA